MICISRQSIYPFATSTLEEIGGQHHTASVLSLGKARYQLYRELGEPLGRPKARKSSLPRGLYPLDRPALKV